MNLLDLMERRDITEGRHRGNPQSRAAYQQIESKITQWDLEILAWVKSRPGWEATAKEAAQHFGRPLHAMSGRFTELKAAGYLRRDGDRKRERSAVLVWTGKAT